MSEKPKNDTPRIIVDWEYFNRDNPAKEGDEWLSVCVPYIGTYGCIDTSVGNYLYDTHYEDVQNYVPDMDMYEEIDIMYTVYLGDYNVDYVDGVRELLGLNELHLVEMSSPKEYNFTTDKLIAQIHKDELWKLYESVKDTEFYKNEVHDVATPRDGYMPWYDEEDFFFESKEDWSDGYDHPAILGIILKAALHEKLDLDDFDSVETELFVRQEDHRSITELISIDSIKMYKDGEETEAELE